MRSALRSLASVLAGFVAASVVMMIVESVNGRLLYPALGKAAEGGRDREVPRGSPHGAEAGAYFFTVTVSTRPQTEPAGLRNV